MSSYAVGCSNIGLSRSHVLLIGPPRKCPLLLISLTSHHMSVNASRWSTLHAVLSFQNT